MGRESSRRDQSQDRSLDLCSGGHQLPERCRVPGVILRLHQHMSMGSRGGQDSLVLVRQCLVSLEAYKEIELRTTVVPTRIVVVGRDLVEAELLIVEGTREFHSIEGAPLERRIDVPRCNRLWYDAKALVRLTRAQPGHS